MAENFQIRDYFNPQVVNALADRLHTAWPAFDHAGFCEMINPRLPPLTYSERLKHITKALEKYLPGDYLTAVDILLRAQLPPYKGTEADTVTGRFITAPQTRFISRNGLGHFDRSMQALYEMTRRFTAEWDIRPFLEKYPEKTLAVLARWANDPDPHVRRLVSEGSRPLLPWGKRLKQFVVDPSPTLALLELLKNDPSEYVRRSVANHLNDHAKNHPDLVVKTLTAWKSAHTTPQMERLIRHATRTLVKNGHAGALALLGYKKGAEVKVSNLSSNRVVRMGDYLSFTFNLIPTGKTTQKLVIDYVIYFKKADGSLAPKVFKLKTMELPAGSVVTLQKKHSFRPITTRVYYAGAHALAIQVNGEEKAKTGFELRMH